MFTNYSQTYAATITTVAGFIILVIGKFNTGLSQSDIELGIGVLVSLGGIIWQVVHRHSKGDVTVVGSRK